MTKMSECIRGFCQLHSVRTHKGAELKIHRVSLDDFVLNMSREATPVYPKDACTILMMLNMTHGFTVLEVPPDLVASCAQCSLHARPLSGALLTPPLVHMCGTPWVVDGWMDVVEAEGQAGSGSGGLTLYLAEALGGTGKVLSFDTRLSATHQVLPGLM